MNNQSLYSRIFNKVLSENSVGSAFGAFGADQMTANQWSEDTYATGDARHPSILGAVTRRTFPETVTKSRKRKVKR